MRCFWLRCARPAVARLMLPTVRLVSNGPGEISEGAGGFAPPSSVMDDKQWAMTSMLLLRHKNGLEVAGVLAEWSRRVASAAACSNAPDAPGQLCGGASERFMGSAGSATVDG